MSAGAPTTPTNQSTVAKNTRPSKAGSAERSPVYVPVSPAFVDDLPEAPLLAGPFAANYMRRSPAAIAPAAAAPAPGTVVSC